jgi:hypothetical protein
MGTPRRHSSLVFVFPWQRIYNTFQSGNDWNSSQSLIVGGGNPLCYFIIFNVSPTPTSCSIDTPEISPGALLGFSGVVTVASSATGAASVTSAQSPHSTSAMSSTVRHSPSALSNSTPTGGSSSDEGAVVGGVVGGAVVIFIAITRIFLSLRRLRSQAPTAIVGTGVSQLPTGEFQRPLTDSGMHTESTLPGDTVVPIKLYVRVLVPNQPSLFLCSSHFHSIFRTRVTQLRSLGTKDFHSHQIPLKDPSRGTMGPQTP